MMSTLNLIFEMCGCVQLGLGLGLLQSVVGIKKARRERSTSGVRLKQSLLLIVMNNPLYRGNDISSRSHCSLFSIRFPLYTNR